MIKMVILTTPIYSNDGYIPLFELSTYIYIDGFVT